jgi:Family of unknown function (DUF6510)
MEIRDLMLDGNALGGMMLELFGSDMTTVDTMCGNCGWHEPMARVDVYRGAGLVVRCRHCENILIRIVQGRDRTWIDLSGTASLGLG